MNDAINALRKKQRETLLQIFQTPPPSGVKWQAIESLIRALGGEIKQASDAGDGFQATVITAITAFTVRVDLSMTDFHQRPATGMQDTAAGNDAGAHVMVDDNLDDVLATA